MTDQFCICLVLVLCLSGLELNSAFPPSKEDIFGDKSEADNLEHGLVRRAVNSRTNVSVPGTKSRQKCLKYAEAVFRWVESPVLLPGQEKEKEDLCAITAQQLIVGGERAHPKEFPHMALIGFGSEDDIYWLCGGSLISEKYVLSAAHCVNTATRGPARWVRLGDLWVLTEFEDAQPVTMKIVQKYPHPQYSNRLLYHDIALFKLEKDVEFSAYIRPICLNTEATYKEKQAIATGWGHTEWRGYPTEELMKVTLDLVDVTACNHTYTDKSIIKLSRGIDGSSMICAGGVLNKDTCQGDSGGPLQVYSEVYCMYKQLGVTAFGTECGYGDPGVYTRISNYISWIENIVWPED